MKFVQPRLLWVLRVGLMPVALAISGCGSQGATSRSGDPNQGVGGAGGQSGDGGGAAVGGGISDPKTTKPGTNSARCVTPELPTRPGKATIIGDGTPASCSENELSAALETRGLIKFECGDEPFTMTITKEHYVRADTWLDGGGKITFDASGKTRMFRTEVSAVTVFENLKFLHGYSVDHDWDTERGGGAAIYRAWMGSLYILGCEFENNVSEDGVGGGAVATDSGGLNVIVESVFSKNRTKGTGGGLYSVLSDLYIVNSTFSDNHADDFGGGLSVDGAIDAPDQSHPERPGGPLEICGGRFERNTASGSGGGATLYGWRSDADHTDKVLVEDSYFADNTIAEPDGYGGGLYANSLVTVRNSTFARNHASTSGGGVWVNGDVTLENATVYANSTEHSGGGIAAQDGSLRLSHVTVARNTTGSLYGGVGGVVSAPPPNIQLYSDDTIIAWNKVNEDGWVYNCLHAFQGKGNVQYTDPLFGDPTSHAECRENFLVEDPLFAEDLADNGGPVPTLAILASSPAAKAGKKCVGADARGIERPVAGCAAGAYQPQ